jgi:hypothetical protein
MERAIDLLTNDAVRLATELANNIRDEKNIESLMIYTKARCGIIQDMLAAIKKLKQ